MRCDSFRTLIPSLTLPLLFDDEVAEAMMTTLFYANDKRSQQNVKPPRTTDTFRANADSRTGAAHCTLKAGPTRNKAAEDRLPKSEARLSQVLGS